MSQKSLWDGLFPAPIGRAATFDPALEERIGVALGLECIVSGTSHGGVGLDLLRHPRWAKAYQTYGEDPHLAGMMGAAAVRGIERHSHACVQHLACRNQAGSQQWLNVEIDQATLRDIYLTPFQTCIEAGASAVMTAPHRVNGQWCSRDPHLLVDILRHEWGFDGEVIAPNHTTTAGALDTFVSYEPRQLARQAVAESMVLLRNFGQLLPFPEGSTVALIRSEHEIGAARHADAAVVAVNPARPPSRHPVSASPSGRQAPTRMIGSDRASLSPSRRTIDFVHSVLAVNPRTVVVLLGGAPVFVDGWLDDVPALLMAWHPGAEGGEALSDVLTGKHNPSGRLPCTWPSPHDELPPFKPWTRRIRYGPLHGYRRAVAEGHEPAFWFGFGLSYSRFEYVSATRCGSTVMVDVHNCSTVDGIEVVQCYSYEALGSDPRPLPTLLATRRVAVPAGETVQVELHLPASPAPLYVGPSADPARHVAVQKAPVSSGERRATTGV